jgi:hypothetical protein
MIFAEQQWKLRQDTAPRVYGNVYNALAIHPQGAVPASQVHLVVPTEFFQLSERLFTADQRLAGSSHSLVFYIDQVSTTAWVFGVEMDYGVRTHVDLWGYSMSTLPPWIELAAKARR